MAFMIYGVSKNGKRGIGYVEPRNPIIKPKENMIKPKILYSHFTYGHNHEKNSNHKAKAQKTYGKTNKESKRIWVPKDK
jgi:hypothetical protein